MQSRFLGGGIIRMFVDALLAQNDQQSGGLRGLDHCAVDSDESAARHDPSLKVGTVFP